MRHTSIDSRRLVTLGIGVVVVFILGARGTQSWAQTAGERTWLRVDTVQVKPEMWTEYREIERDEVIPALRQAGVTSRSAWRTAEFGSTYELVLVRPVEDFGVYDSGDSFSRLAPREAERLRERLRRCLVSRESAAILVRSDLGVGETGRPFAVVTTMTVAPGRGQDYENFLRETLPSLRKAGVIFGVYERRFGQPSAWLLVENIDSLRELTLPSALDRAFGEEGAGRLVERLSGILTSIERKVLRFDPELSFSYPRSTEPQQ